MSQTAYATAPAAGVEGQLMSSIHTSKVLTGITAGTTKVGKFVCVDTTAGKPSNAVRVPAGAGDIGAATYGVTMFDPTREGGSDYAANDAVPVVRKGRVLMQTETAIVKGTNPFVRHTGAGLGVGSIRNDVDGTNAVQLTRAVVMQSGAPNALVEVEIDL